jgi:hypothetical protein
VSGRPGRRSPRRPRPDLLGQLTHPVSAQAPDGKAGTGSVGPVAVTDPTVVVVPGGHLANPVRAWCPAARPVGGDGPDDKDVQGDEEQRPERVVGDEQEVGDGAQHDQGDPDHPGPGAARQQPPAGEGHQQPDQQVDPAPGGGVELEQVIAGGDIELVLEDRDEPLQRLEHADHDHHDRGEQDEPDRRAAGSWPRADRDCDGDCSLICRISLCGWAGPINNRSAGPGASSAPPSHQGRAAASLAKDDSARAVLASLCSSSARMVELPARRFIPFE